MITITIAGQSVSLEEQEALNLCGRLLPAIRNPATVDASETQFGALLLSIAPTPPLSGSVQRYRANGGRDFLTTC